MPRHREEDEDVAEDYESKLEEEEERGNRGGGSRRKRGRSNFIDDNAEEDSQEDEEDDEDHGNRGSKGGVKRKKHSASILLDREAHQVDDEDEEEEEDVEDDSIVDTGTDKTVSLKSITAQNVTPTSDELEKFNKPSEIGESNFGGLSTLLANRKEGHFMKGDAVIVIKGDLKNLKGWVEKVDEENVLIRSELKGFSDPLAVNERELCKYFGPGNHVKVVSGTHEGATGMVVNVNQHVLTIWSDTTKEHVRVFADHVEKSSEVTTRVTKIGHYGLHDLVLLDNLSFGVIIRLDNEVFQVLIGVPDRPEVALVKPREIKCKIQNKINVQDRYKNVFSVKDDVRIIEGPSKGKQGPVKHIYKGVLFIYDRRYLEHAGFACAKCTSCTVVAGRGGADYSLLGTTVKIRRGRLKGYTGPVVEVKGNSVRVKLEMKIVTVDREAISNIVNVATPSRDANRDSMGSETPMHPSLTPLHPYMTRMRDFGGGDVHKTGGDSDVGVIRDVSDGTCKVSLRSSGEGDTVMVLPSELETVPPRKNDRVKIVGGQYDWNRWVGWHSESRG